MDGRTDGPTKRGVELRSTRLKSDLYVFIGLYICLCVCAFCRVLRNSTPRFVCPLVRRLVDWLVSWLVGWLVSF